MSDIKNTIFKILFEDPSDETDGFDDELDQKAEKVTKHIDRENFQIPKASEILYGKQTKTSSFIDYFPKDEEKVEEVKDEQYEMRDNVSPIFGLINQKPKKKKPVSGKEISKAVTNTNKEGEYSGIVLSPIYGYDDSKANDARKSLATKDIKDEIVDEVQEDFNQYDDDLPFEMVGQENDDVHVTYLTPEEDLEELDEQIEISDRLSDDFLSYRADETTQEITKEDVEKAFKKIQDTSESKSVYDTTPIKLFELEEKEDKEEVDDLFADLSGDKD